jgi:hypothetical protein
MARTLRPSPKLTPTGVLDQDILRAHPHSIDHRAAILASDRCGCFFCLAVFEPSAIEEWIDFVNGVCVTALCPKCGIDSVIGTASGYPVERAFLARMRAHWFA